MSAARSIRRLFGTCTRRLRALGVALAFSTAAAAQVDSTACPPVEPPKPVDSTYLAQVKFHDHLMQTPALMVDSFWRTVQERHEADMQDPARAAVFHEFMSQLDEYKKSSLPRKVEAADQLIDAVIGYESDSSLYNNPNHWATPLETITNEYGDCEDFAILKYYALKYLGVPQKHLRVALVSDHDENVLTHAVTAVDIPRKRGRITVFLDNDRSWVAGEYTPAVASPYETYFVMNDDGARVPGKKDLRGPKKKSP